MFSRPDRPPVPDEVLERPDVGVVAAVGGYAAVVLVAATVSVALATGGGAAAVVGGVSTAGTIGLVAGALLASGRAGLAERLGRRRRHRLLCYLPAAGFALATAVVLATPAVPSIAAAGTGLGTVATALAAAALAGLARTRYAEAVVDGEPVVEVPRIHPARDRHWFAVAATVLTVTGGLFVLEGELRWSRPTFLLGLFALLLAASYRQQRRAMTREESSSNGWRAGSLLPDRPRRKIFGSILYDGLDAGSDEQPVPQTVRVHESGLVLDGELRSRFVPWAAVRDVRLTDDELVVERSDWLDLRCARVAIEDADGVREAIERTRDG